MARPGSPKKPRTTMGPVPDPDATPRQSDSIYLNAGLPRKRELELRNIKQYPLRRKRMTAGIAHITPLMRDLAHVINGPTIPHIIKVSSSIWFLMNRTQCRIHAGLRDPDPFISDARIDYGIFFQPREVSLLYSAIKTFKARNENNRVAHVQLTDERDTPLAISIETKIPKSTGGELPSLPHADPDNLPMLPVIFVNGADWRLIIWESIHIDSTDSSHGCYAIIAALRRLAGWERAVAELETPAT
ncbi:hypothetical protein EDB81DRAFT_849258 [Dactylonectria macrodidyma]|uniref:PD-(D/E)XK nuclease-like domain-containing protein n=1 Tax=Dactylonectria macrodidyma TaxID=307937 RepID=A0A9P9I6T3_9HYPO|nr:hypothetical protein EDB81DRAFT_849258 [Dactylonectria macrodidyma]